jgi:hypothetical protein
MRRIVEMYKTDFHELGYEASPPKGPLDFGGAGEASLGAPAEGASVFPGAQRAWARQHVLETGDAETLDDAVAMMGDWAYHPHKEVGPGSGWEWTPEPAPPTASPPPPVPQMPDMPEAPPLPAEETGGEATEGDYVHVEFPPSPAEEFPPAPDAEVTAMPTPVPVATPRRRRIHDARRA